jgi:hypothetical protein
MLDLGFFHFCLGMEILYNKELGILSIDHKDTLKKMYFKDITCNFIIRPLCQWKLS